jgi:uncharacterized protein (DUF1330 family)
VVTYRSVKNPEAWKAFAKLAVPPIESAGGCFLARSNPAKTYEAGMNERVVLVEFPSLDKAVACRDTPAYKEALKALGTENVERDMRVVEGSLVSQRDRSSRQRRFLASNVGRRGQKSALDFPLSLIRDRWVRR